MFPSVCLTVMININIICPKENLYYIHHITHIPKPSYLKSPVCGANILL